MTELLDSVINGALIIHTILIAVAVWRIWRGENVADRLIGVELVTTMLLGILVLLSLTQQDTIYIDIAIALAALGFVVTIALAKYLADEQMY